MSELEAFLDAEFDAGKAYKADKADWLDGKWAGLALPEGEDRRGNTSVPLSRLKAIGERITVVPEGVDVHKNVRRVIEARKSAIETGEGIDWATGGHMAVGTLLTAGLRCVLDRPERVRGNFPQLPR